MCVIYHLVLCYLNSPDICDFHLLHARESSTCKSVVENCVIFFPSSLKISCVAAFCTDSLSQFCVLTLLLIFSWVLIITSLAGSRVPALLELFLCCCHDSREQTLCLLPSGSSSSFLFWSKISLTFNHYGSITRFSQPELLAFKV